MNKPNGIEEIRYFSILEKFQNSVQFAIKVKSF